jgi:hypothetical protein
MPGTSQNWPFKYQISPVLEWSLYSKLVLNVQCGPFSDIWIQMATVYKNCSFIQNADHMSWHSDVQMNNVILYVGILSVLGWHLSLPHTPFRQPYYPQKITTKYHEFIKLKLISGPSVRAPKQFSPLTIRPLDSNTIRRNGAGHYTTYFQGNVGGKTWSYSYKL